MATKTVIISGATSGIGLAAAVVFAKNGWKTFAGVRTQSKRKHIVEAAENNKVETLLVPLDLDVTKTESVTAAVKHVLNTAGRIDVVVNNAGFAVFGAVENITEADFQRQFDTNVLGVLRLTQAVLPHFRAKKSGRIVNVSSVVGTISFPYSSLYASTKWALEAFSQSLSAEVAPFGIHVTVVQPGFTKTPFVLEDVTGTVKDPVYEAGKGSMKKTMDSGLATGADASVVGDTIYKAAVDSNPQFRYQPTAKDAATVASVLKDPTGPNTGVTAAAAAK